MNDWSHWYRVDGRQNRLYNKNNMCGLKNIGIPLDVPSSGATSHDFALAHSLRNSWGRQVASLACKKPNILLSSFILKLAKRKEYVIQLTNQNIK